MNRKQGNNSKAPLCVKEGSKIKNFCGGDCGTRTIPQPFVWDKRRLPLHKGAVIWNVRSDMSQVVKYIRSDAHVVRAGLNIWGCGPLSTPRFFDRVKYPPIWGIFIGHRKKRPLFGDLHDYPVPAARVRPPNRRKDIGPDFSGKYAVRRFQPERQASLPFPPALWGYPCRGHSVWV